MPRLTSTQWLEARQAWEADPTRSMSDIARDTGVSIEAVSRMSKRQGWVRVTNMPSINRAAQVRADSDGGGNLNVDVEGDVEASTPKKPLLASIEASTELRAKLIQAHRAEWRKHASMYTLDAIRDDFDVGKSAKISAEMLAIRQKGERVAWGMDDSEAQTPAYVIERTFGK